MSNIKINRAFKIANIPDMPTVRAHILKNVEAATDPKILKTMTSEQLAMLFAASNISWHDGKAHAGATFEGDCVWIGRDVQKLIPLLILKKIELEESCKELKNDHFGEAWTTHSINHNIGDVDKNEYVKISYRKWVFTNDGVSTFLLND